MKMTNSRRKISDEATNLAIKVPENQCDKKRKRESRVNPSQWEERAYDLIALD